MAAFYTPKPVRLLHMVASTGMVGTMRFLRRLTLPGFLAFLFGILNPAHGADYNALVLKQIQEMPKGGGYMAGGSALVRLKSAIGANGPELFVRPSQANPSFCSSATYLVLVKVLEDLMNEGVLHLDSAAVAALLVTGQSDGEGVWGRWNANGPGTARLFAELKAGRNFLSWEEARPGDFMKIFWTKEIGAQERGHSVVYLGTEIRDGKEWVRFWSSNLHEGYGEKAVPKSKVQLALFSRLEDPSAFASAKGLPVRDSYLASMLTRGSSLAEVKKQCGI